MNEPMTIKRGAWYDASRAAAEAVLQVIPDASVSVCDTGEGVILPAWAAKVGAGIAISPSTTAWIKASTNVFYSWHWYGMPKHPDDAVSNVQAVMKKWNVPSFATEFMSCDVWKAAAAAGISHSYWHYSAYCNTGPDFGNRKVPDDTFGACILGWASGSNDRCT